MRQKTFLLLAFVIFLLAVAFFPVSVLEIKQKHGGEVFFRKKVISGEVFHFRYIHSVEKIPVEATFEIEKDGFLNILETRYSSYGPGLPSSQGEKIIGKGWMGVKGGGRLEKFSFIFSSMNKPSFKFKEVVLDLGSKIKEGEIFEVSVKLFPVLFMATHIDL
jgi:hypothetical protein